MTSPLYRWAGERAALARPILVGLLLGRRRRILGAHILLLALAVALSVSLSATATAGRLLLVVLRGTGSEGARGQAEMVVVGCPLPSHLFLLDLGRLELAEVDAVLSHPIVKTLVDCGGG